MLLRAVQDSLGFILNRIKWEVVSSSLFIEQLSISFKTFPSEIKITLLILTWFIIWLPIAIFVSKKIVWKPLEPLKSNQKILLLSSLYLLVPVLIFLILILDDKSLANYGLVLNYKFLIDFFLGLFISLLSLIILFKIEEKFNYLKWNFENKAILKKILLPTLSLVLWIGLTEELVFRGLIQTILEDDHNILIAAIICNVVFMLLHLIWEREETIPQLPGLWLMGMVLTEAKWFYGSLGMPWGLHAGWILGISLLESAKLITYTDSAGNYIVGVKQKPLAGIMGILSLLITAIILWCLTMF